MTTTNHDYWNDFIASIETGLASDVSKDTQKADNYWPLVKFEQLFRESSDYRQLMAALIDIKLTFHFLASDFMDACVVYNEQLHQRVIPEKSSTVIFQSKMLFLRHLNSFVLRCRAFWDKAMGVLVLVYNSSSYRTFLKATSRRSQFKKAMKGHLTVESIDRIDYLIDLLDSKFRTAEAHQTGTLRTWIFKEWDVNPMNTPFGYLLTVHNMTFELAQQISKLLIEQGNLISSKFT